MSCWRNDDASKENLHFDDQVSKLFPFFFVAVFSKGNRKDVLAKVSLEPNQKSNDLHELSMNRKCGESDTTGDRRTFTKFLGADEDIVHRDQTVGNKKKDAKFDYKSGFYLSEEKRNCHICDLCHNYYILFFLKQSALSAVIFQ